MSSKILWKIACQEDVYPGMWQRWFKHQCVAVGWPTCLGFHLNGETKRSSGWIARRNAIKKMVVGDTVIVALKGNKIGRIGEITGKAIEDDQWDPLVPAGPQLPDGEMGRRILVRWDLTIGPDDRDMVVQLPPQYTLTSGELRPTVSRVRSCTIDDIRERLNDPQNWIGLAGKFRYERSLSDYIAGYPHRLEDGLLPHPDKKVRERVFKDKSRLDVLLIDGDEKPVIVECKQHSPTTHDIDQLRHYIERLREETDQEARGILVHGGSRKLSETVAAAAKKHPRVDVFSYRLEVDFLPSLSE